MRLIGAKMAFVDKIRELVEGDMFSMDELKGIFCPPLTEMALRNKVARVGELLRLRRGLYLFPERLRKAPVSSFAVANKLYAPSYVSFESALSYHGLIPEGVYTTTSACFQRKNKTFTNALGDFSFDSVPCRPFFMGVERGNREGLLAHPLRALFDLIYTRRKKYASIDEMEEDWRMDLNGLRKSVVDTSTGEMVKLARSYKKKNIKDTCQMMIETFK